MHECAVGVDELLRKVYAAFELFVRRKEILAEVHAVVEADVAKPDGIGVFWILLVEMELRHMFQNAGTVADIHFDADGISRDRLSAVRGRVLAVVDADGEVCTRMIGDGVEFDGFDLPPV